MKHEECRPDERFGCLYCGNPGAHTVVVDFPFRDWVCCACYEVKDTLAGKRSSALRLHRRELGYTLGLSA